ncbi:hypothetical protein [Microlunatus sp. Gsoil 973]|uniref:hypothetical protein n=1 Tax=Microlunatus sp. Gsoil 973 TaxID=2672569 RepID=UPI0012B4FF25|nr:hypothetical protein [Microlunatus sp. Gsoil 973]QGN32644.1 hypothetical protein GJV80_07300 [Microlunatus sp. Gsoil 973]
MTTRPEHNRDLHEFELTIRTELALAESAETELTAAAVRDAPTFDNRTAGHEEIGYEETERYEAGLRSLLGAIEATEERIVGAAAAEVQSLEISALHTVVDGDRGPTLRPGSE